MGKAIDTLERIVDDLKLDGIPAYAKEFSKEWIRRGVELLERRAEELSARLAAKGEFPELEDDEEDKAGVTAGLGVIVRP